MKPEYKISSFEEFISHVCELDSTINKYDSENNYISLFRGQEDEWDLLPKIGRYEYLRYLFSWDEISGDDKGRLIEFLEKNYCNMKNAKIENVDDGKAINVTTEKNSISLKLNDENTNVYLKINDIKNELMAQMENSKLNIYKSNNILVKEKRILEEFQRLSFPYLNSNSNCNEWDMLALAQHHRLPTRLLDWTENPLAALWFAFIKEKQNNSDRVVWCLVVKLDEIVDPKEGSPFKQNNIRIFKPNHITKRIAAQSGWFTVHTLTNMNKFHPLNKHKFSS